jgi:F0F1-type ATP synthase assembly protein I
MFNFFVTLIIVAMAGTMIGLFSYLLDKKNNNKNAGVIFCIIASLMFTCFIILVSVEKILTYIIKLL